MSGALLLQVLLLLLWTRSVRSSCVESVNAWLQDASLHPRFTSPKSELHLNWSSLDEALRECPFREHFQVELWSILESYEKEADFGSRDFWALFERCNKISPEMLRFHSHIPRRPSEPPVSFRHVVERSYILRLCSCASQTCSRTCFSLNESFCSPTLRNQYYERKRISPWCRQGESREGIVSFHLAEEHNCSSLQISGEIQTCTAVQDYDSVEVTLRPVRLSTEKCPSNTVEASGTHTNVPLTRSEKKGNDSEYTGYFNHYFVGLSADSKYCAQIEIKGNPYCRSEYVLNDFQGAPSVCSKYLDVPLRLSGRNCSSTGVASVSSSWGGGALRVTLIILSLFIISLLMSLSLFCLNRSRILSSRGLGRTRRKNFKGWPFFESPEILPRDLQISPPLLSQRVPNNAGGKECNNGDNRPKEVLFIHFKESTEIQVRSSLLKRWLSSLSSSLKVIDLNDDESFEETGLFSEANVESLIARQETQVIILNSPLLSRGGTPSSPRESLLLLEDNASDLKYYAIDFVRSNYYANYEKVTVINFEPLQSVAQAHHHPITPGRNVTLPEHFSALRTWILAEDGELSRLNSPLTLAIEKEWDAL